MDVRNYRADEVLDDGRTVVIRSLRPEDRQALQDGFARLSQDSVYERFFEAKHELSSRELDFFSEVDFIRHVALGAELMGDEFNLPIGVGRYISSDLDPRRAEFSLTVVDAYQGLGVGSLLLRHLSHIAQYNGIEQFVGTMLTTNKAMNHLLQRSRYPILRKQKANVTEFMLTLTPEPNPPHG